MRPGTLARRTALKRGSVPLATRTRLRPVSMKAKAKLKARRACREVVMERAGGRCEGGDRVRSLVPFWRCQGRMEVHEPLTRARGGDPLDPTQCLLLCAACHRWAHTNPVLAAEIGLLVHSWDRPKGETCK